MNRIKKTTHFGYQTISENQKTNKIKNLFKLVEKKYDLMNDLISLGIYRF
ncbi:class I SAM-dependent methyltransferase [Coxiella-like endosymbiont]|nr:class I SAM-dependent methyltransferase [Coxiella-like endosymbiont]PMB54784.1 Ubiquinone/menaquinone biosynthesis methyltransferase UbiE [Coxiella-like endosymbiont]